jgi:hypothetical protein
MRTLKYLTGLAVFILFMAACAKNEINPLYGDNAIVSGKVTVNGSPVSTEFHVYVDLGNSYWEGTYINSSGTYNLYVNTEGTSIVNIYVYPAGLHQTRYDVTLKKGGITEVNFDF